MVIKNFVLGAIFNSVLAIGSFNALAKLSSSKEDIEVDKLIFSI